MTKWSRLFLRRQHRLHSTSKCLLIVSLVMLLDSSLGLVSLDQYFYRDIPGNAVQEYMAEPGHRPDFLYSEQYPTSRIVEFYAHWCPHCQHFKPKYIEFSNKLAEALADKQIKVETYAVSCVPNKAICSDLHIHGYPTIMFYPPYSVNGTKINPFDLHPMDVMRMVGIPSEPVGRPKSEAAAGDPLRQEQTTQRAVSSRTDTGHNLRNQDQRDKERDDKDWASSASRRQQHFAPRSKAESYQDAHLSFDFAMRTAVYTSVGPLPEQPKKALSKFLRILQKTLPASSTMHPVVDDLIRNFASISQKEANLNAIMERYPPPTATWSPASLQHGTGYTAGLWQLFHIMSVGMVEWNHMAMTEKQRLAPREVADSLRDYVEFFFQCEVCRLNFLAEYDACSYDRCNRLTTGRRGTLHDDLQYPLWLFETHNAVNVRLRKERIELHDEAEGLTTEDQVMWPPADDCPSCWLSEGRWDEMNVFEYLLKAYWPESDHSQALRTLLSNGTDTIDQKDGPVHTDEFGDGGFKLQSAPLGLLSVSLIMFVAWERKRRFDQKGFHKKKESDVS